MANSHTGVQIPARPGRRQTTDRCRSDLADHVSGPDSILLAEFRRLANRLSNQLAGFSATPEIEVGWRGLAGLQRFCRPQRPARRQFLPNRGLRQPHYTARDRRRPYDCRKFLKSHATGARN